MPWLSALPDPRATTSSETSPDNLSQSDLANIRSANLLWLYSLLLSISCALTALSLQQWVRPQFTLSHYSLPEQLRLGADFAARMDKSDKLIKILHSVIIASLVVFFSGLLLFFWAVNHGIFYTAFFWTVLFFIFHARLRYEVFLRSGSISYSPFTRTKVEEQPPHTGGVGVGVGGILKRTLDMLRSDDDLEQFFEAIPGFCASKVVGDPRLSLDILGRQRLAEVLVAFWKRTLSSRQASESVKGRRLVICISVIEATELFITVPPILPLFSVDLGGTSLSVEIGHTLRILRNGKTASLSRGVVASIISNSERNDRWFALVVDELGISGDVLRDYLAHGDSVLLANLIHITRQFFHTLLQHDLDPTVTRIALKLLPSVSKFNILNTGPELQHDFCALWNEIVQQVRSSGADVNSFIDILVEIQYLYASLHGNDAALGYIFTPTTGHDDLLRQRTSYPFCMVPEHRSNLTTHIEEVSGNMIGSYATGTTTTSPTLSESSPRDVHVTPYGHWHQASLTPPSRPLPNQSPTTSSTGDVR